MAEPLILPFRSINNNGIKVAILISVFWALSTFFVGLRFYARYLKSAGIMIEDWLVMGALVCMLNTALLKQPLTDGFSMLDCVLWVWNRQLTSRDQRRGGVSCYRVRAISASI